MNILVLWIAILAIFFCGIGIVIALAIAAERIDELLKSKGEDEDDIQD